MKAAAPPRSAIIVWVLLLGGLAALLVFAGTYGEAKRKSELRHLLFANSRLTAERLSRCLMTRMPLTGKSWKSVEGMTDTIEAWNGARGLRVRIVDAAMHGRRVEISTPGGRPLRDQEAEALRTCLSGG